MDDMLQFRDISITYISDLLVYNVMRRTTKKIDYYIVVALRDFLLVRISNFAEYAFHLFQKYCYNSYHLNLPWRSEEIWKPFSVNL